MNRTITIEGLGFSTDGNDAEITISLNGTQVFQGPVITDKTQPIHVVGTGGLPATVAYSWEIPIAGASTADLEIACTKGGTGGGFLYTRAQSNYMPVSYLSSPGDMFSTGTNFINCFAEVSGLDVFRDPNTNVVIDGVSKTRNPTNLDWCKNGQWYWPIYQGQTLSCTLNISAGLATPVRTDGSVVLETMSYTGDGATKEFVGPAIVPAPRIIQVYVDSVLTTGKIFGETGTTDWVTKPPKIIFETAPAAGANIVINAVEDWDRTFESYYGFELNNV